MLIARPIGLYDQHRGCDGQQTNAQIVLNEFEGEQLEVVQPCPKWSSIQQAVSGDAAHQVQRT